MDTTDPTLAAQAAGALPFDQRACFIAGPAKSGTSLLVSLLDGHPELLVLPEETAYFPTVLTKYGARSRREQFDYLTKTALSSVLFGGPGGYEKHDYSHFPTQRFREAFERAAFDPVNAERDLLVILLETYAAVVNRPLDSVRHWIEKTPANRNHLDVIYRRFPKAKVLLTIRDPRALLAAQIKLEDARRRRRFSIYLCMEHWRAAARLALSNRREGSEDNRRMLVVPFEGMLRQPADWLQKICAFLEIDYDPAMHTPTKAGRLWTGNSAAQQPFAAINDEPVDRWRSILTAAELGWVEWHCREWMEPLGYEPIMPRPLWKHWVKPVRGETPKEYLKSRLYSLTRWSRH
jgi:protein-tyrosine sulfotransferase